MAEATVLYWRDIPAQIVAREGRRRATKALSPRFQEAIDRAAMKAGLYGSDAYLAQWRRGVPAPHEGEPEAAAAAVQRHIEEIYDDARLERLVAAGGSEA